MILPRPVSLSVDDGEFELTGTTAIVAPAELTSTVVWLQQALRPATGLPLPHAATPPSAITLTLDPDLGAEAYTLTVSPTAILITGGDLAGVFYGCQTLLQLLPPAIYRKSAAQERWAVPAVQIQDAPQYAWRGAMLDVARHFMPKHNLLRFIDLLALHRLNILHLHLTDDQGWRVQIQRYPRLTEVGAWRRESPLGPQETAPGDGRPHGGFYTQDDIREIVGYAAARHITVIPEIDIPGHSQAAIAAYPQLGVTGLPVDVHTRWGINPNILNTEDSTVEFFCHVFDEITDLFPGRYIGIGGDECPKQQWAADPRTQQLMRQRGIDSETELQAWFLSQIADHLRTRGRRVFAWDDVLEGPVPHTAAIASWRGMTGARTAARRGLDVVACPDDRAYLDYRQSEHPGEPIPFAITLTLQDAYGLDPMPSGLTAVEQKHVLGGQANIWTEHMDSPRTVDYYAFPRLCAIAEALWSSGERDFAEFGARLTAHLRRLDALGVEYRHESGPLPWQTRPGIEGKTTTRLQWAAFIDELVTGIKS